MRRIAALSLEMRSRSAAISCLSPSGLVIFPSSPTRRATGFGPARRTRCAGPNRSPVQGHRRDAPVPMTAHGVFGKGICTKVHVNATEISQRFTLSSRLVCIIWGVCIITLERCGDPVPRQRRRVMARWRGRHSDVRIRQPLGPVARRGLWSRTAKAKAPTRTTSSTNARASGACSGTAWASCRSRRSVRQRRCRCAPAGVRARIRSTPYSFAARCAGRREWRWAGTTRQQDELEQQLEWHR